MNAERIAAWRDARNVLCVRLDNLGDVLMTTPAIHALKAAAPERRITLLASSGGAEAAGYVDAIDEVIRYDAPWVQNAVAPSAERDLAFPARLRERQFDAAVIFTVYSQNPLPSALLCYLSAIPLRLAHCRENPYRLLTDWIRETEPAERVRHEVQRQLDLVAAVGASADDARLRFDVPPSAERAVASQLAGCGIAAGEPLIVIHPGASASSRRYPAERFGEVARALLEARAGVIAITGDEPEHHLAERVRLSVRQPQRIVNLAGSLTLAELAALIARARLLISNNTGPVHLAAAVGTPVVDLYALTNPQHTPWMVPHRVLYRDVACRYCYKSVCPHGHNRCLHGIEPFEVITAAAELLDRHSAASTVDARSAALPAIAVVRANPPLPPTRPVSDAQPAGTSGRRPLTRTG